MCYDDVGKEFPHLGSGSTTHNHGFFLSAVLLKCMGRLAYSSNNVEVLLPLSLLGHSKNMYIEKSGLGR